jgi:uncharacterized linocin/CFP29 family protein
MADNEVGSFWTGEQWSRIRQATVEEARAARVAANVLPVVGPLEPEASFAPGLSLIEPSTGANPVAGYSVDDATALKLATLQVKVFLREGQLREPGLTGAVAAFRRAANVLAHLEDEIVFNGQPGADTRPESFEDNDGVEVIGGDTSPGLALEQQFAPATGEEMVEAVTQAIGALEEKFQTGPFACFLGNKTFRAVQAPNYSFIVAQDRILPMLNGGPVVRSSALAKTSGIVVALGARLVELVVATDVSVEFLQTTPDAWFVFRVYEKMVLRIKDRTAIGHVKLVFK